MTYPKEAMFPSLQRIWGNAVSFWPALVAVGRGMWIEPLVQEVWCEHKSLSATATNYLADGWMALASCHWSGK